MPIHNADISEIFNRLAELLEIEGANPFRIRAYRNAARTIGELPHSVATLLAEGKDLTELPGIGEDLAAKIEEIVRTGKLTTLEKIERKTTPNAAQQDVAINPTMARRNEKRVRVKKS